MGQACSGDNIPNYPKGYDINCRHQLASLTSNQIIRKFEICFEKTKKDDKEGVTIKHVISSISLKNCLEKHLPDNVSTSPNISYYIMSVDLVSSKSEYSGMCDLVFLSKFDERQIFIINGDIKQHSFDEEKKKYNGIQYSSNTTIYNKPIYRSHFFGYERRFSELSPLEKEILFCKDVIVKEGDTSISYIFSDSFFLKKYLNLFTEFSEHLRIKNLNYDTNLEYLYDDLDSSNNMTKIKNDTFLEFKNFLQNNYFCNMKKTNLKNSKIFIEFDDDIIENLKKSIRNKYKDELEGLEESKEDKENIDELYLNKVISIEITLSIALFTIADIVNPKCKDIQIQYNNFIKKNN